MNTDNNPVVFFDGVCNFCNASVNFIIDRDKRNRFRFAALQSDYAHQQLTALGVDPTKMDTVVLLQNGRLYQCSTAALRIAKQLDGLWPLWYVFIIVPPFIRNFFYDIVARNRYRWFGKRDTCRMPTPEERERFLEVV